jgi:predicted dehydrogenase
LQYAGAPVKDCMGDLRQLASAGDVEDHVKAFIRCENGVTFDMEVTSAQTVPTPLPKWIVAGSCGTLTSDGSKSTLRWFDPVQAPKLEAIDGPATNRKYGNEDKLPWQERVTNFADVKVPHDFYDNVFGVLRRGEPMDITPESVREVIRTIALIRKGTAFPGKVVPPKPEPSTQPATA